MTKLVGPALVLLLLAVPTAAANDRHVVHALSRLATLFGNKIAHLVQLIL